MNRLSVHVYAAARRRRRSTGRSGQVHIVQVHPAAWRVALQLADGDTARLRVRSRDVIVVLNRGRS